MATEKGMTEGKLMIVGPGYLPSAGELIKQLAGKGTQTGGQVSSCGPVLCTDLHTLFLVFPIKYTK